MYRCVVAIVLLPCLLLTQLAVVGHFHGTQPAGHDLHPHFHVAKPAAPQGHRHGPGGHHHHHDVDDDEQEPTPKAPSQTKPSSNHDDDVIYPVVDLSTGSGQTIDDAVRGCSWVLPSLNLSFDWVVSERDCSPPRPHPSPHSDNSECPLYVRHLALLI